MDRIGAAVVGGGVVGCAVGLGLPRVGGTQSGRNSGVVQAGIMVHLRGAADWLTDHDRCDPDGLQLLGIDSPCLSSSLAIARRVRRLLLGPAAGA